MQCSSLTCGCMPGDGSGTGIATLCSIRRGTVAGATVGVRVGWQWRAAVGGHSRSTHITQHALAAPTFAAVIIHDTLVGWQWRAAIGGHNRSMHILQYAGVVLLIVMAVLLLIHGLHLALSLVLSLVLLVLQVLVLVVLLGLVLGLYLALSLVLLR